MTQKKTGLVDRFLNIVEKGGNALPHPVSLFAIFALMILVLSWVGWLLGWTVRHPGTNEDIAVINLLSKEGLDMIIVYMVHNFTSFVPLGIVLVALMGIGVAESSGLIGALIRQMVISSPKKYLTFFIVLTGILSNMASDLGYVLLIPLAGVVYIAIGRHPIIGMAAAFAGVSGGFSANLFLGTIDPLVAGLSEEAAQIIDPSYSVNPTANYYFMVVSTFLIAFSGTWVTEKIIAPRYPEYKGKTEDTKIERLSLLEKKGVKWAFVVFLIWLVILLVAVIPEKGILRGADGGLLSSPLIKGVIAILFLVAGTMGLVYGIIVKKFKNEADVYNGMADSLRSLANYIVLVFFAAQFVAYFKWSNLGIIFAIEGASMLSSMNIGVIPLMILFIILSAIINMFMGSASAKWAIMAPVFVPMFMLMGFSPELSQAVYRIGDSITNVISPMMSFFALIIAYFQVYDKKAGIGSIISTMIPYTFTFFIVWSALLVIWILFGLPLGPGAGLYYSLP